MPNHYDTDVYCKGCGKYLFSYLHDSEDNGNRTCEACKQHRQTNKSPAGRQMAATFWIEVVCDDCAKTGPGEFFTKRAPIKALTKAAIGQGWRLKTSGTFECGDCTKTWMKDAPHV